LPAASAELDLDEAAITDSNERDYLRNCPAKRPKKFSANGVTS
jgi:hypothetical protein